MKTLRILAPVDETVTSVKALGTLRGLASTVDVCFVELLHALRVEDSAPEERDSRQAHAEEFLARQAELIAGPPIEASCRVAWGDPADVVLERVHDEHFDFICMATRAVPDNTGQPGSVAARLFRESPVPIIALPANTVDSGEAARHANRAFFRAAVYLPAELEAEGVRHPVEVVVRDLGAKGAELETAFVQPFPTKEALLILSLPTRPEPLEIAATIVGTKRRTGDDGEALQVLHLSFPTIGMADQDAIVAFLNQLRTFEQHQRRVRAPVTVEVITGPRAYAHFRGHTTVVRPDYVWLHMDRFDHIEGADISLRVYSADGKAAIEVDGTVTSEKAAGQEFDIEVEIPDAAVGSARHDGSMGARLMAFVRQHYRDDEAAPEPRDGEAQALIPRPIRVRRQQPALSRAFTATPYEPRVPTRAPRSSSDVPLKRRVRDAEARALDSILRPPRKSPPLRSI